MQKENEKLELDPIEEESYIGMTAPARTWVTEPLRRRFSQARV